MRTWTWLEQWHTASEVSGLKRRDQVMAFYFYCTIMLISISYNYCSVLTANKCVIETELTS